MRLIWCWNIYGYRDFYTTTWASVNLIDEPGIGFSRHIVSRSCRHKCHIIWYCVHYLHQACPSSTWVYIIDSVDNGISRICSSHISSFGHWEDRCSYKDIGKIIKRWIVISVSICPVECSSVVKQCLISNSNIHFNCNCYLATFSRCDIADIPGINPSEHTIICWRSTCKCNMAYWDIVIDLNKCSQTGSDIFVSKCIY